MAYETDALRSNVPGGFVLNGWRLVGPYLHPEPLLIIGGPEGVRFEPREAVE